MPRLRPVTAAIVFTLALTAFSVAFSLTAAALGYGNAPKPPIAANH